MFDFFKDIYYETHGLDINEIKKEKNSKRLEKKQEKILLSHSQKRVIYVIEIAYLLQTFLITITTGIKNPITLIIHIILIALDISTCICLAIRKKQTEIAALILLVIFLVFLYTTSALIS